MRAGGADPRQALRMRAQALVAERGSGRWGRRARRERGLPWAGGTE